MILPPFFGHKTPSNDGEPYRIHYSYIGEDAFSYDEYPKSVNKHTYIGTDVLTYKIRFLPPLLIHTYLSQDALSYQKLTKTALISYCSIDCLSFQKRYPPEAPFNILAVPGNSEVYLSWSAPESYQLPIKDYIIKYTLANPYAIMTENDSILRSENGEPLTLENAQSFSENWILFKDKRNPLTSITVTGLVNNNTYSFKVAAVNAAGRGKYGYSNNVTPQATSSTTTTTTSVPVLNGYSIIDSYGMDGLFCPVDTYNGKPFYKHTSTNDWFIWHDSHDWLYGDRTGGSYDPTNPTSIVDNLRWTASNFSNSLTPPTINWNGDLAGATITMVQC
jgi:hypothetical protein